MAKKIKHVPSDFSKPKPGTYLKKSEDQPAKTRTRKPKPRIEKSFETKEKEKSWNPNKSNGKEKISALSNSKEKSGFYSSNSKRKEKTSSVTNSKQTTAHATSSSMPLNKYVAHCGICSRREAADLIKKGKVKVNSLIETEPGTKVTENDYIFYEGKRIFPVKQLVYYLMNKPKNTITTTDDPEGRHTVTDLLHQAPDTNVYPVGRLDRNTTGLLLLTNDGDLAQKLTHPKYKVKKVYQVTLDKPLTKEHFAEVFAGVMLEDGKAPVDDLAYVDPKDKRVLGIEIHIGRNRIVRRIFESLGYQVKALDRVIYAGLTKKNLQRGHWRELTPKEVIYLKHYSS